MTISPALQKEIEERMASGMYRSVDDLIKLALKALDGSDDLGQELLERELLRGLEGEEKPLTPEVWDAIEREALETLRAKKKQ